MSKVELHTPAPFFSLENFAGGTFRSTDFTGRSNVLLVFNRGFT